MVSERGSLRKFGATLLVISGATHLAPGHAQESGPAQEAQAPQEVTITGSRIRARDGMETPTPVTAVQADEIKVLAPGNLVEAMTAGTGDYNVFLNVANVLDEDPPVVATWSDFFGASTTIPGLHDPLGRRYTLGVEIEF